MRVLHFILGKANKDRANGVNQVIAGLAKYSVRHGADVRVIGKAGSAGWEGERIARDGFEVEVYSRWASPLRRALAEAIEQADIVHLHGAYAPLNLLVGRLCKQLRTPYVVTLHNGLAPESAVNLVSLKKKLFHNLFQKSFLQAAAGIHVLTEEESTDLFNCARPGRVFCLPNGIDLDDFTDLPPPVIRNGTKISIGYLGRLSPEKNLDSLCEAFVETNVYGNLQLNLAGPDSSYGRSLLARHGSKGLTWVGPKYGAEKIKFLQSLDMFVLPSRVEGFSIAAAEVLAVGTPLLITRTSKMSYFYDTHAFFMCEPTAFGIKRGLHGVLNQRSEWPAMVSRGRQLIEKQLNWAMVAQELLHQYKKILSGEKE